MTLSNPNRGTPSHSARFPSLWLAILYFEGRPDFSMYLLSAKNKEIFY